jgi:tetratricopeptide (TPR) repeat protein
VGGEYVKAIAAFTEAILLEPTCASAYSNRGHAYFAKSKYDKAISDCTEGLRLDPQNEIRRGPFPFSVGF